MQTSSSVVAETTPWPSMMIVATMNGISAPNFTMNARRHDATGDGTTQRATARRNGRRHEATARRDGRRHTQPLPKPIEKQAMRRAAARRDGKTRQQDATARRDAHLASLEHHTI